MIVFWHRQALRDLEAIEDYISQDDPVAAARVVSRIRASVDRLSVLPLSGRPGPGGIRLLSVAGLPYVVVHRVQSDHVRVLAVVHTSRNRRF
jgi:toxin ParE1/3/4